MSNDQLQRRPDLVAVSTDQRYEMTVGCAVNLLRCEFIDSLRNFSAGTAEDGANYVRPGRTIAQKRRLLCQGAVVFHSEHATRCGVGH